MEKILEWLYENKEWIFSGIGVAIIGYILNLVFSKENVRNSLKAFFNFKSTITQINIENKEDEKK